MSKHSKNRYPFIFALGIFLLICKASYFYCPGGRSHVVVEVISEPPSVLTAVMISNRSSAVISNGSSSLTSSMPLRWSTAQSLLRTLAPAARSRRFSARATEFFTGYHPFSTFFPCSPCDIRFFMTWISSEDLGTRELQVMESLFKSNPDACLLIVSHAMDSARGMRILKPFVDEGFRVAAMSPDFYYLFKDTPALSWFERVQRGDVDPGDIPLGQNLSNLLRLALLYKLGGIYIDTDVIVLKSLSGFKNVIGAQSIDSRTGNWSRLNNAVLIFDKGHPLVYKFIEEFASTFDGNKWGHNGPMLLSRVVSRVADGVFEFAVLPPMAFYPVDWERIRGLFHGPVGRKESKWASAKVDRIRKESFTLHLWNRVTRKLEVEEGSAIGRIFNDSCILCNS